jgi:membrane-bound lytic murein transglycosylase D
MERSRLRRRLFPALLCVAPTLALVVCAAPERAFAKIGLARALPSVGAPASAKPPPKPAAPASAKPTSPLKPASKPAAVASAKPAEGKEHDKEHGKDGDKDARELKKPGADGKGPSAWKPLLAPDPRVQRAIAGGPPAGEPPFAESPELRALREAELDWVAGAAPMPPNAWPSELPAAPKGPLADTGGLPPSPAPAPPAPAATGGKSLAWLSTLKMPDLPMRWDARVVRYLEFFKDDPRGRRVIAAWHRKSGRYRALITEQLRARSLPEDLMWVAMAESGFDPTIRSPAGASGLWQFTADAAKVYGMSVDRWADMRHSPLRSTEAGATYLADLKRRFGTWELALAAYNMGYGGLLSVIKRHSSNDYWELSRMENALPWETTLYVPKILAMAVVARNPEVFGLDVNAVDAALSGERVEVPAGTELRAVAQVAGCTQKELEQLNPELRAGRTPPTGDARTGRDAGEPSEPVYTILVPKGRAAAVKAASAKLAPKGNALERYTVRFGESLDMIATTRKTTRQKLAELNGLARDEAVRAGTTLLVPQLPAGAPPITGAFAASAADKPTVVVAGGTFVYPDRQRVFYRVLVGDGLHDVAEAFGVTVDQLRAWNAIDPSARLLEGMTLQIFVKKGADLGRVVATRESDVHVVAVGSDAFFDAEEAAKGRKRVTHWATAGETVEQIGKKYGLSPASMEKINRRPRSDVLKAGEAVIVYVPRGSGDAKLAVASKPAVEAPTIGGSVGAPSGSASAPGRSVEPSASPDEALAPKGDAKDPPPGDGPSARPSEPEAR